MHHMAVCRCSAKRSHLIKPCGSLVAVPVKGIFRAPSELFSSKTCTKGENIGKTNLQEIPDLDGIVARAGGQHGPVRVEGHTRHPIPVTLTAHEEVAIRHGPHLPSLVIAHRGNYRLRDRCGGKRVSLKPQKPSSSPAMQPGITSPSLSACSTPPSYMLFRWGGRVRSAIVQERFGGFRQGSRLRLFANGRGYQRY